MRKIELLNLDSCLPLEYAEFPNVSSFVYEHLGDRCAEPSIVIPTAVIYGLILLLGILGNVCTCLVILKNKSMQNPTNYYLFSLAISDLLVLVLGLPVELYGVFDVVYPYKFGEIVCRGRAFLTEFTSYASILTITCFSVERWLAICFPLRVKLFSTLERAIRVIIAVWICAFIAAFPVVFIVVVNRLPVPEWVYEEGREELYNLISAEDGTLLGTEFCAMDFQKPQAQRYFIFVAFFLFFLMPAFLITLVYCHIVYRLHNTDHRLTSACKQQIKARKGILKILVSVVVMFFLCWLPFHIQRLLSIILNESEMDNASTTAIHSVFNIVFYISGYCYYSNSACNPILYNILSAKYRLAFCKTILGERITARLCFDPQIRRNSSSRQTLHNPQKGLLNRISIQTQCSQSVSLSPNGVNQLGFSFRTHTPQSQKLLRYEGSMMVPPSVGRINGVRLNKSQSMLNQEHSPVKVRNGVETGRLKSSKSQPFSPDLTVERSVSPLLLKGRKFSTRSAGSFWRIMGKQFSKTKLTKEKIQSVTDINTDINANPIAANGSTKENL